MSAPGAGLVGDPKKGRQVSIDWLDVTSKEADESDLLLMCERILGPHYGATSIEVLRDDGKRYSARGPLGMYVHADRVGSINRDGEREPWAGLQFRGDTCRAVGSEALCELLRAVRERGGMNVSRIDLALDDYDKRFSPRFLAEQFVDGRLDDETAQLSRAVITRVKGGNWNWSRKKGGCFWVGGDKSDRRLRVYDKDKESGGAIPSTRAELQMRDRFALDVVERMLRGGGAPCLGTLFFRCLVSLVDLREPQGDRSASHRWPRPSWWGEFVGEVDAVRVSRRDDSGFWQWLHAMQRQVSGFLAVLLRAFDLGKRDLETPVSWSGRAQEAAAKVARVVGWALGGEFPELSATQTVRLEQLRRELARGAEEVRTPE